MHDKEIPGQFSSEGPALEALEWDKWKDDVTFQYLFQGLFFPCLIFKDFYFVTADIVLIANAHNCGHSEMMGGGAYPYWLGGTGLLQGKL